MRKLQIIKREFSFMLKKYGFKIYNEGRNYNSGCFVTWEKHNFRIMLTYANRTDKPIVFTSYYIDHTKGNKHFFSNVKEYSNIVNNSKKDFIELIRYSASWLDNKIENHELLVHSNKKYK